MFRGHSEVGVDITGATKDSGAVTRISGDPS